MSDKIVLRRYPSNGPIKVAGMIFKDVKEIGQMANVVVRARGSVSDIIELEDCISRSSRKGPTSRDGWCVVLIYEPYPCFDSYDFASENRHYNNYVFHSGKISLELIMEFLHKIPMKTNYCLATLDAPAEYLPIVYYDEGHDEVTVAELSNE